MFIRGGEKIGLHCAGNLEGDICTTLRRLLEIEFKYKKKLLLCEHTSPCQIKCFLVIYN